jgi:hypothetical protein
MQWRCTGASRALQSPADLYVGDARFQPGETCMSAIAGTEPGPIVRWDYVGYCVLALAVMAAAIVSHERWFLNFVHVITGLLWTGIDLFMGFVIGPILRSVAPQVRREIVIRLLPRTLFLLPTLSIINPTAGWVLASDLGFLDLPWPHFGWVAAALGLVVAMTILGLGYLLPTNLRVCIELRKPDPDLARISGLTRYYFLALAAQGTMQILTIVIMARFVSGI